jgi:hypothetical protein
VKPNLSSIKLIEWIFLTTVGLGAGLIGGLFTGMSLGQLVNAMVLTGAVTCAVGGGLGAFQAFGLRRRINHPFAWTAATAIGIGVGLAIGVVVVEQTGILMTGQRPNVARLSASIRALSFVTIGLIAGMAVGAAQWLVLRRDAPKVRHWIPATGFGLAVAFGASSLLVDASGLRIASVPGVVAFIIASGVAFGAVTAWPLRNTA